MHDAKRMIDADKDLEEAKNQLQETGIEEPNIDNVAISYEDGQNKTVEDILPSNIFRGAVFRAYSRIFERRNRCLVRDEIPTDLPRQENLETFFRSKVTSSRHRLQDMDIARAFKEAAENSNVSIPNPEWEYCRKLASTIRAQKNPAPSQRGR